MSLTLLLKDENWNCCRCISRVNITFSGICEGRRRVQQSSSNSQQDRCVADTRIMTTQSYSPYYQTPPPQHTNQNHCSIFTLGFSVFSCWLPILNVIRFTFYQIKLCWCFTFPSIFSTDLQACRNKLIWWKHLHFKTNIGAKLFK